MPKDLPALASVAALDATEGRLGFALPPLLRRLYAEVANGGFGPGGGLLSIEEAVAAYAEMTHEPDLPKGYPWPAGLLPLIDTEPGQDCVEASTGRVVSWDAEGLSERSTEKTWLKSLGELAPLLEAWLGWLDRRPDHELLQERIQNGMVERVRASRARIAAMSPEERRAMGLPEVG